MRFGKIFLVSLILLATTGCSGGYEDDYSDYDSGPNYEDRVYELENELEDAQSQIEDLESQLDEKEQELEDLQGCVEEYEDRDVAYNCL